MAEIATQGKSELICVAVATLARPRLLAIALEAACKLTPPPYSTVEIVVVDNDNGESARNVTLARAKDEAKIHYLAEPQKGVSNARNRALDFAIQRGARWLAFFDDDAAPRLDWLIELLAVAREQHLHLVGGPVVFAPLEPLMTRSQASILGTVAASAERHADRNRRKFESGGVPKVSTQNWLGDLSWIERKKLRFDPQFNRSGGEDSDFADRVRRAGGRIGWAQAAIVDEAVPVDRLNYSYQYKRQFNFGVLKAAREMTRRSVGVVLKISCEAMLRYLLGGFLLIANFVAGTSVRWAAVRNFARASGLVSGIFGRRGFDHIHGA